ncbi:MULTISPECIES: GTPase [Burkholderia cepacia complex]|uniref:GTPase n=1 Tax=Burkholderia cepacia complex TaxID=87882 RepID=UPI001B8ED3BF|nr:MULTISPECIES: GTPase [Burkholderia cepacia complex]MBR8053099.1 50S ribosome-binding GTPase [Burkholderia vietnamiensis]WFN13332.1 GTP-binding DUF697 domain-containing protein [Burkholderia contaminans]HDR9104527.1 50S ribosome-binding GTPase [Burkholderia vietnamiensis]
MSIHEEAEQIRDKLNKERDTIVSVALFGQPGAGKSSLINMIVGKDVAEVGVETDKTVEAGSYESNGLRFVDLPGYGTSKFPKDTYFDRFDIQKFDLFLCVTSGKLHDADTEFFNELARRGKVCIFVVNKEDELWERGVTTEELKKRKVDDISSHVGRPIKVLFTSCRTEAGLDELNTEIKNNLDGAKRERWLRGAKAYSVHFLQEKKEACEKYVTVAAAASALNAINPIPGADIAVDFSILLKLFSEIRDAYGLSEAALGKLKESAIPIVGRLANNVLQYAAKEGLLLLMKNMLGKQTLKEVSKYVPLVGQAIAATAGYAIASSVGGAYLKDCHDLAHQILEHKLDL